MKTDSIIQSKTIMAGTEIVKIPSKEGKMNGRDVIFIKNTQSTLKGLLWDSVGKSTSGFAFFTTAVAAGSTIFGLMNPDLLLTPYVSLPIVSAVTAYASLKITRVCLNNAMYHLDDRNQKVAIAR